ncbi:MAG: Sau3AI family type II restriction endonuclease [Candidatus Peregrinibacteria bacterium]|nr:Sau3AI family type II restriction endonuclease [Candidatus Peregrinibacteria bacterium]
MTKIYQTKEQVLEKAKTILLKSLRGVISKEVAETIENQIGGYGVSRKGFFGELMEKYFFDINPGNVSAPDFTIAGVELKTTPLKKHAKNKFASKERLVFSMINYDSIVGETWELSSFLKKNKTLLLMFYLWIERQSILDYEFKFVHLLNLLEDISSEDVFQIQKDWEYIVAKIKRGEAHLLSEGDTYYLGACTKAANSRVVRDQPLNRTPAKPRAFSFKQQYINYLIQTKLLGEKTNTDSIFKKQRRLETIEDVVREKFSYFIGKTDKEILAKLESNLGKKSKSYKRLIVNRILGVNSSNIEELEKANITLKVITLESTGMLKESMSFPAFDYKDLVTQPWYDDEEEVMSDFHLQLETKKFLFVVFQKQKDSDEIVLRKTMFWNFPMKDIGEAENVWQKTIDCINEGRYDEFPKIKYSAVAHVRPHGKNSKDTIETPQKTQEMKRCFWLNAKYIQRAIENN